MVIPAALRLVGRAPPGREPPAMCSMLASWVGFGKGKPSVVGILYGIAEALAMARAREAKVVRNILGKRPRMERNPVSGGN